MIARALEDPMRIVFVSMECAPWSKTGGMGDVVSALPIALSERGHHVMSIVPMYDRYDGLMDTQLRSQLSWSEMDGSEDILEGGESSRQVEVRYFYAWEQGVHRVFVDNPCFSLKALPTVDNPKGLTREKIYGYSPSTEYPDNDLRMSLLCQAAIDATRKLQLNINGESPFGEKVIFVCNDWHTAPLPLQLKYLHHPRKEFMDARVAFCLHNAAYQGRFPVDRFRRLNLPDTALSSLLWNSSSSIGSNGTQLNWLQAAILDSDLLLTVSNGYAQEVVSSPHKGFGLDHVIRLRGGFHGIVNGIDVVEWNPSDDKYLDEEGRYSLSSVTGGKLYNKRQLQKELGLEVNPSAPLMAFIGRLDQQKGVDMLLGALPEIFSRQVKTQFVALGSGNYYLEDQLKQLSSRYPGRAIGLARFSTSQAHQINAAADYMIVPSRFEPCGLVQLHAMAYGTVPIVAPTGGLLDTVTSTLGFQIRKDGSPCGRKLYHTVSCGQSNIHEGMELLAKSCTSKLVDDRDVDTLNTESRNRSSEDIDPDAIVDTVSRAISQYNTELFLQMRKKGMEADWSWREPARQWEEALQTLWKGQQYINS